LFLRQEYRVPPQPAPKRGAVKRLYREPCVHNPTYRLHRDTLEVFLAKWPFGSEEYTNLSSGINSETKSNSTKNNPITLLHKQPKGFKILPQKHIPTIRYRIYLNS